MFRPLEFPATFRGTLPCADCAGILYTLNLFEDSVYYLRMSYLNSSKRGRHSDFDEVGRWTLSYDKTRLVLGGISNTSAQTFNVVNGDTLTKLDLQGNTIASKLSYDLVRAPTVQPLEPTLLLTGMYTYVADAGRFRECLTGREFSVAQENQNAVLEKAYSEKRKEAGEAILLSVEGTLTRRARTEGSGNENVLVVQRFLDLWPGDSCGMHVASASLENTTWNLRQIRGKPVNARAARRAIYVLLGGPKGQLRGFGGCNNFSGSYAIDGDAISFDALVSTKMMCRETVEIETRFFDALDAADGWKILGETLELYAHDGTVVAKFDSRSSQ